jgi:hypothetical protein
LFKEKNTNTYEQIKKKLVILLFASSIGFIISILAPLELGKIIDEKYELIFTILINLLVGLIILEVEIVIDKRLNLDLLKTKSKMVEIVNITSIVILASINLFYYLITHVNFPDVPSTEPSDPTTRPDIQVEQVFIPLIIVTVIISIFLIWKYRNKIINQILFIIMTLEVIILFAGTENFAVLIIVTVLALLVYPLLFFLEKFVLWLKNIYQLILELGDLIKKWAQDLWKFMVKFYFKFKIPIYISIGLILGVINYYFLYDNFFFSGLILIIVCWPISPETQKEKKEITEQSFGKRVVYRGLIAICTIGSSYSVIPSDQSIWIIPLFILAFMGYVLWMIKKSEEIYQLPIYWRFTASVIAILDFVFMMIFLLRNLGIIAFF